MPEVVSISFTDLRIGARFLTALPRFLRHPVRSDEARAIVRRRLATRETDFLDMARRAMTAHPDDPYRFLFKAAGCELGDLEPLVRREGVEGTLQAL